MLDQYLILWAAEKNAGLKSLNTAQRSTIQPVLVGIFHGVNSHDSFIYSTEMSPLL